MIRFQWMFSFSLTVKTLLWTSCFGYCGHTESWACSHFCLASAVLKKRKRLAKIDRRTLTSSNTLPSLDDSHYTCMCKCGESAQMLKLLLKRIAVFSSNVSFPLHDLLGIPLCAWSVRERPMGGRVKQKCVWRGPH